MKDDLSNVFQLRGNSATFQQNQLSSNGNHLTVRRLKRDEMTKVQFPGWTLFWKLYALRFPIYGVFDGVGDLFTAHHDLQQLWDGLEKSGYTIRTPLV